MKKELKIALKTMSIKAKLANKIRTDIYKKKDFSEKEKEELFEKWITLGRKIHIELNNYKTKRKLKAKIEELRKEREKV